MNKEMIIRKSQEFTEIINLRNSVKSKYFSIFIKKISVENKKNRYGITVPKKVGNAVVRNKIKRQLKNIIYNNEKNIHSNYDYVIIIKEAILNLEYCDIEQEFLSLIKKVR